MAAKDLEKKTRFVEYLREYFPKGSTIFMIEIRSSDISHEIACFAACKEKDGAPFIINVSHHIVQAGIGRRGARYGGVVVRGGGMDMGVAIATDLSRALYSEDYAIKRAWL